MKTFIFSEGNTRTVSNGILIDKKHFQCFGVRVRHFVSNKFLELILALLLQLFMMKGLGIANLLEYARGIFFEGFDHVSVLALKLAYRYFKVCKKCL